jgi:hypothetical protein
MKQFHQQRAMRLIGELNVGLFTDELRVGPCKVRVGNKRMIGCDGDFVFGRE